MITSWSSFFIPFILIQTAMLKNYLNIAWRNLLRNKLFSLINITGLSIGLNASIVIFLVVEYEFSFEQFHPDKDRIFRITSILRFAGDELPNEGVPAPLGKAVGNEIPGIEEVAVFHTWHPDVSISNQKEEPKVFKNQDDIILADHHYFNVFPFHEWVAGSPETSLNAPFAVVLTESRAKTYFSIQHATEAIGKEIIYYDSTQATVTGIVKDLDEVSDLTFKEFLSLSTIERGNLRNEFYLDEWNFFTDGSQLFVRLQEKAKPEVTERLVTEIWKKNVEEEGFVPEYKLQPLTNIHFNMEFGAFGNRKAHKPTLYGLLVLGLFLLLLGCINFINLTTAASSYRAREISVRKTFGGQRIELITQFLSETLLITFLAAVVSVLLVPLVFQLFSDFLPAGMLQVSWMQPQYFLYLSLLVLGVGIIAGFYPAIVLSGFQPVWLIKNQGHLTGKGSKIWLRQSLIVFQFVIAICLVVSTLIVSEKIRFALNKDLGFKKEAIVTFFTPYDRMKDDSRFVLANKIRNLPGVMMVSLGMHAPASGSITSSVLKFHIEEDMIETSVDFKYGDPHYLEIYQIDLLAGRNLQSSDTLREFVINETYARMLGFSNPEEAVGAFIQTHKKDIPVVGVVKDFHLKSIHEPIKPTAIATQKSQLRALHIALTETADNTDVWKKALNQIEGEWKEIYPDETFNYQFFDESIAAFYQSEQNTGRLLQWATGLAILISFMGLFGLATYTVTQRTKEIGIRKVLGASVGSILMLLSKDYFRLVLIAFLVAVPIANYFITEWLNNFAYRIEIQWWLFAIPGILVLLIALFSVSGQTWKAARKNPVDSLRYE